MHRLCKGGTRVGLGMGLEWTLYLNLRCKGGTRVGLGMGLEWTLYLN
jgi:hypothetical protein